MVTQDKFRPYLGLPSEPERLQTLRDFLQWCYQVYTSRDLFSRDFHVVLNGLRVSEGVTWEREVLPTFVEGLSLEQCRHLQEKVRSGFEKFFYRPQPGDPPLPESWQRPRPSPPLSGYPRALKVREAGQGQTFYASVYSLSEPALSLEGLSQLMLLRLCDLLHGLNTEALVQCAVCTHYTVRRHPKGKEFCSPQCRWKAAATRRQDVKEPQKGTRRGGEQSKSINLSTTSKGS